MIRLPMSIVRRLLALKPVEGMMSTWDGNLVEGLMRSKHGGWLYLWAPHVDGDPELMIVVWITEREAARIQSRKPGQPVFEDGVLDAVPHSVGVSRRSSHVTARVVIPAGFSVDDMLNVALLVAKGQPAHLSELDDEILTVESRVPDLPDLPQRSRLSPV